MDEIMELKDEIKESERIMTQLDKKLANLKLKFKSEKYSSLLKEIKELDKRHNINLVEIDDYKSQISQIEKILKSQKSEINDLKKENDKLKANIQSNKSKSPINKIKGIKDLTNSFGLKKHAKKKEQNEKEIKI